MEHDCSALSVAVEKGYNDIAELLLEYRASPNNKNGFLNTSPLMSACQHRNKDMAQLTLNFGADINYENMEGVTALVLAARHGDLEIVHLLLDYGAYLNQKTKYEYLPLGVRWSMDYPDAPKEFCAELCEPYRENTVLMGACREGHIQVVTTLLCQGVDIHSTNSVQNTALHVAAYSKSQVLAYSHEPHKISSPCPEIVAELLRKGANVDALNMTNETAIDRTVSQLKLMASYRGELQTVTNHFINFSHLLKAGSPLPDKHIECSQDGKALFKLLLGAFNLVQSVDSIDKMCLKAFIQAVKVTVYSGIKADQETINDIKSCLKNSRIKQELVEFLEDIDKCGYSLKQLCRIRMRQLIKSPLMINVMSNEIVFPSVLRQYIILDYFA
jgi:ankyrin repeat protein